MTHRSILPALALGFLLAVSARGQHHSMGANDYDDGPGGGDSNPSAGCAGVQAKVTVSGGLSFSPATVTIDAGQPVCWTWSGTEHTVKADDGSFTSGPPSASVTFQRTFNDPGTYGYYCQVHGSTSGGMRGTVVVRGSPGGGGGGGTLAFSSTSYAADEGVGALTVTVERTGGSDGAATVKFETAGGSARSKKDFTARTGTLSWGAGDPDARTIEVPIKNDKAKEKDETFTVKLSRATGAGLGASSATVTIHDDDGGSGCGASVAGLQARGESDSEILLAWAADGGVRIERREPGGAFREIAEVEAGVGSFTDAGLPAGTTFQYRVRSAEAVSGIAAAATDGSTAPCDEARALCLGGGRFEAVVEQPGARRTRLPELLLDVQDGCAVNGHYWLSFAAVTDAELTVKVRDTQTGRTWVSFKPAGSLPAPVRDVEAFASCP